MTSTLFIKIEELKKNSLIDINVSDKLLKLTLVNTQDQIIEPVLGTTLYEDLLAKIRVNGLSEDETNLITKYIWPSLIHGVLYKILNQSSYAVTNQGIISHSVPKEDINGLRQEEAYSYKHYTEKLSKYLQANGDLFPLYGYYKAGDIAPTLAEVNYLFDPRTIEN